ATDRAYFHGREELSRRLEGSILAHRAVVVHGPSGSGKSSLIQASVLPNLRDAEDVRVVQVDGWPPGEDPTQWLAVAMSSALKQGAPATDVSASEAVFSALRRAVRGSSRLLIIYIDQLEQLFYPDREPQKTEAFFDCINDILDLPLRTLRIVLSLREDYLGVFRDRLRDHRRVLGQGFRVGPLTVAELSGSVCQTAASGSPAQTWSQDELLTLMMQVRVPGQAESDDAEAQAAYGQIVCRALFQERAAGKTQEAPAVEAAPILERYLETTLAELGPLRPQADLLLEDHLVSGDGGRTLRTEKELGRHFSSTELQSILRVLEGAAILHAASHQGSRYFEIGHDWLARKVFERRQLREQEEQRKRQDAAQKQALDKLRRERRILAGITVGALVALAFAIVGSFLILDAKKRADEAQLEAKKAALIAQRREIDARDASILAGVRELSSRGKLTWAMKLLPEVQMPAIRRGWVALASDLLAGSALESTLEGHTASLTTAYFSPDGKRILTASVDGTARIWDLERKTSPLVLSGHTEGLISAVWSHDGKRVLTTALDGTARIYDSNGSADAVVLGADKPTILHAEFSPDDTRIVTANRDGFVRMYATNASALSSEIQASKKAVLMAVFHPDGKRVFFSTDDQSLGVWDGQAKSKPVEIGKHDGASVFFLAINAQGTRLASVGTDEHVRIWDIADKKPREVLKFHHDSPVNHLAFSADGLFVATASLDRLVRVFNLQTKSAPFVHHGHTQAVSHVAFHPKDQFFATTSYDGTARVFRMFSETSFVLRGHDAAVRSIAWNPAGTMLVTAAGDGTDRSPDETARIWNPGALERIGYGGQGIVAVHSMEADGAHNRAVTVHGDEVVRVFERSSAIKVIASIPSPNGWVAGASISPNGQLVATASFDKLVRVFNVDKPGEPIELNGHTAAVRFARFSPDGQRILSGGEDGRPLIFSLDPQQPPITLSGHRDWLSDGTWSPDGKRVVTASYDQTARIWNADGTGVPIHLDGHTGEILAVAYFADGERVVTASADHTARIWKPGAEPRIFRHDGAVTTVAASPDGKLLATYASDHLIRFWRTDSDEAPIELESPTSVRLIVFEKDSRSVVTIDDDGATHVLLIDVDDLRDRIAKANADCLPASLRVLYLNESVADAEARFTQCKQNPFALQRLPELPPGLNVRTTAGSTSANVVTIPTLAERGPDAIRAKVVVLPPEAEVEVDGVLTQRRQGIIEFVAKVGQTRKLHVQRGAKHRTFEITIGKDGASPARIDLNEKLPGSSGPRGGDKPAGPADKPVQVGVPGRDPLLNDVNN
ncbi:MAG TPA: hypothetical protein PK156_21390, partial [Polyangium sp.]|nr:hypothetical protein [Polyangium sp.]